MDAIDALGELVKGEARGGRYFRRVATGNPKRPWRYFYSKEEYVQAHGEGAHLHGGDAERRTSEAAGKPDLAAMALGLKKDERDLEQARAAIKTLRAMSQPGGRVGGYSLEGALRSEEGLKGAIANKKKLLGADAKAEPKKHGSLKADVAAMSSADLHAGFMATKDSDPELNNVYAKELFRRHDAVSGTVKEEAKAKRMSAEEKRDAAVSAAGEGVDPDKFTKRHLDDYSEKSMDAIDALGCFFEKAKKPKKDKRKPPYSEAQRRWAFSAEERGELPDGDALKWSKRNAARKSEEVPEASELHKGAYLSAEGERDAAIRQMGTLAAQPEYVRLEAGDDPFELLGKSLVVQARAYSYDESGGLSTVAADCLYHGRDAGMLTGEAGAASGARCTCGE